GPCAGHPAAPWPPLRPPGHCRYRPAARIIGPSAGLSRATTGDSQWRFSLGATPRGARLGAPPTLHARGRGRVAARPCAPRLGANGPAPHEARGGPTPAPAPTSPAPAVSPHSPPRPALPRVLQGPR